MMKLAVFLLMLLTPNLVLSEGDGCEVCSPDQTWCVMNDTAPECKTRSDCTESAGVEIFSMTANQYIYATKDASANMEVTINSVKVTNITAIMIFPNDTNFTMSGTSSNYDHAIPHAQKSDEGSYKFRASGLYNGAEVCATADSTLYVLTTAITPEKENVHAKEGDNVTISLNVVTEIRKSKIVIQVTKPDNSTENINLSSSNSSPFEYEIINIETNGFGKYDFDAFELTVPNDTRRLSSSASVVISDLQITSKLNVTEYGQYIAVKGKNSEIVCVALGGNDTVKWLDNAGMDVKVLKKSYIYQEINENKATLVISTLANYRTNESFTCSFNHQTAEIRVNVEGPPKISPLSVVDGTFLCAAEGNPTPTLQWHVGEDDILQAFFGNPNFNTSAPYYASSSLSTTNNTFCLGDMKIMCKANNSYDDVEKSYQLNSGNTSVFMDDYINFSMKKGNFSVANSTCGGRMLTMKTTEKKEFVTASAAQNGINSGFYIGAIKTGDGTWRYPDNTEADVMDEEGMCAKCKFDAGTWTVTSTDCGESLEIVCEFTEESSPKNLALNTDTCDGGKLNATWDPVSDANQSITINNETPYTLPANEGRMHFSNLTEHSKYTVKVESQLKFCVLHTYAEEIATTSGPPKAPDSVQMSDDGTTNCTINWIQNNAWGKPESFWVTIKAEAVVDEKNEFSSEGKTHFVLGNITEWSLVDMYPNTLYKAVIVSTSCAGNSTQVNASGNCSRPIGVPDHIHHPSWNNVTDGVISTKMQPQSNRAGPVSCQFLVVHYVGEEDTANEEMTDERFLSIKQANVSDIHAGDEYFAYATVALDDSVDIALGSGGESSCTPLPKSSTRRRSVANGEEFKAKNRNIPLNVNIRYFSVVTILDEKKNTVYIAKSKSSNVYMIEQRNSPDTSKQNTAVIVLSIFATIIGIGLLFFLYRRCRGKKGRPSFPRFSYSAKNENVYDTL